MVTQSPLKYSGSSSDGNMTMGREWRKFDGFGSILTAIILSIYIISRLLPSFSLVSIYK